MYTYTNKSHQHNQDSENIPITSPNSLLPLGNSLSCTVPFLLNHYFLSQKMGLHYLDFYIYFFCLLTVFIIFAQVNSNPGYKRDTKSK